MIFIDCLYINKSGGKILLEYFIEMVCNHKGSDNTLFLIDQRFESDILTRIPQKNILITTSGESQRKKIYKFVLENYLIQCVYCFNNIPPPVKINNAPTFIYFHNVLLLGTKNTQYNVFQKLRFYLKTNYVRLKNRKNYTWIVQSEQVKKDLVSSFNTYPNKVLVMPFFRPLVSSSTNSRRKKVFLYPADGVPQKNHHLLFKTWEYLADDYNVFPELYLTLDPTTYPQYVKEIARLASKGVQIKNLGVLDYEKLLEYYQKSEYLIFPSLKESFGLPLIEASSLGCKVIVANLPYVNAIIKPSIVFDPYQEKELAKVILGLFKKNLVLMESSVIVNNKILEIINLLV